MKIYTSPYPSLSFPRESLYTFLFETRWNDHLATTAAFIDGSTANVVTRAELKQLTLSLAYGLRSEFSRLGGVSLRRGDVVMIFSPNNLAFPISLMGGIAAGLCMSLASAAYTPRELEHQWKDSRAKAIIVHPSLLSVALKMFERLDMSSTEAMRRIVLMGWQSVFTERSFDEYISLSDLFGRGSLQEEEKFSDSQAEDTAVLCYSSGTTGKPKGVEITHRTAVAELVSTTSSWPTFRASNPRMLGFLPFYHIFGAVQVIMAEILRGAPVVVMSGFDPVEFCKNVETYKITHACVVPPICLALVKHPAVSEYNLQSLEYLLCGAAPLSLSLLKAFADRLRSLKVDTILTQGGNGLATGYGLTESVGFQLPTQDWLRKAGSIGLLMANFEARLISDEGEDVKEGLPGELWLRGPGMFKGYLGNTEATKAAITEDRWFKTGDILTRDSEGYFAVVDRKKELIKYKGYQVAPAELESVLLEHPEIVDAGVVGITSEEEATELPRAYVVHAKSLSPTARRAFELSVEQWIKDRVARHKQLRGGVVVLNAIPKSPSGKILRRVLRDQAELELGTTKQIKSVAPKL